MSQTGSENNWKIYTGGKSLRESCREEYRDEWVGVSDRMRSYVRSLVSVGVGLGEYRKYIPLGFLEEYDRVRDKVVSGIYSDFEKPLNYDFMVRLQTMVEGISERELVLDFDNVSNVVRHKRCKKFRDTSGRVEYDIHGVVTGRLGTKRGSFPIHSFDRECRSIMVPTNDFLVELDYNAAEVRTIWGLLGREQHSGDLHEWHSRYFEGLEREEVKKRLFSFIYNPSAVDKELEGIYSRGEVVDRYYDGENVTTMFGRVIPSDDYHAFNYIIQSTTSDIVMGRMMEVSELLSGRGSFVKFSMHDSIVIDLDSGDRGLLGEIRDIFSETEFGRYGVSVEVGRDYGDMRRIEI